MAYPATDPEIRFRRYYARRRHDVSVVVVRGADVARPALGERNVGGRRSFVPGEHEAHDYECDRGIFIEHLGDAWRQECADIGLLREAASALEQAENELRNAQGERDAYWDLHKVAAEWEERAEKAEAKLEQVENEVQRAVSALPGRPGGRSLVAYCEDVAFKLEQGEKALRDIRRYSDECADNEPSGAGSHQRVVRMAREALAALAGQDKQERA